MHLNRSQTNVLSLSWKDLGFVLSCELNTDQVAKVTAKLFRELEDKLLLGPGDFEEARHIASVIVIAYRIGIGAINNWPGVSARNLVQDLATSVEALKSFDLLDDHLKRLTYSKSPLESAVTFDQIETVVRLLQPVSAFGTLSVGMLMGAPPHRDELTRRRSSRQRPFGTKANA